MIHARTCDVIACNDNDNGDGAALPSSLQTRARLAKMTVDWDVTAFASSLQMMADWDDAAYANRLQTRAGNVMMMMMADWDDAAFAD